MRIDILASGCIKYLFGVPGITFVYVNKILLQCESLHYGLVRSANPFSFEVRRLDYANNAFRFDTGTPAALTAFAAGAGIKLANDIGQQGIAQRIDYLSEIALLKAEQLGLNCVSRGMCAKKAARPQSKSRWIPTTWKRSCASATSSRLRAETSFASRRISIRCRMKLNSRSNRFATSSITADIKEGDCMYVGKVMGKSYPPSRTRVYGDFPRAGRTVAGTEWTWKEIFVAADTIGCGEGNTVLLAAAAARVWRPTPEHADRSCGDRRDR